MSDEWTTNTTRVIVKRYAKQFNGDTKKGLARYLTKQRNCREYNYWVSKINTHYDVVEPYLGDES